MGLSFIPGLVALRRMKITVIICFEKQRKSTKNTGQLIISATEDPDLINVIIRHFVSISTALRNLNLIVNPLSMKFRNTEKLNPDF